MERHPQRKKKGFRCWLVMEWMGNEQSMNNGFLDGHDDVQLNRKVLKNICQFSFSSSWILQKCIGNFGKGQQRAFVRALGIILVAWSRYWITFSDAIILKLLKIQAQVPLNYWTNCLDCRIRSFKNTFLSWIVHICS